MTDYRLIVVPRTLDVFKTNISLRREALRAFMPVVRRSMRPETEALLDHCFHYSPINFLPPKNCPLEFSVYQD